MSAHKLRLNAEPFRMVESGAKTIESRLFDEKRQKIAIGDRILFVNRANGSQVECRVEALHRYDSFLDLFANHRPKAFGGKNIPELLANIRQYYSKEEESQYGVVGIEFTLV